MVSLSNVLPLETDLWNNCLPINLETSKRALNESLETPGVPGWNNAYKLKVSEPAWPAVAHRMCLRETPARARCPRQRLVRQNARLGLLQPIPVLSILENVLNSCTAKYLTGLY